MRTNDPSRVDENFGMMSLQNSDLMKISWIENVMEGFQFAPAENPSDEDPYRWIEWYFEGTHMEIHIFGKNPVTVSHSWGSPSEGGAGTHISFTVAKKVSENVKNDKGVLLEKWRKIVGTD